MSKSILIIDTPKNCNICELCGVTAIKRISYCSGNGSSVQNYTDKNSKPDWCPLKEIPKKIDENNTYTDCEYYRAQGFNSCINEILKEHNKNEDYI